MSTAEIETWVLNQLQQIKQKLTVGQEAELATDTATAVNNYSEVINLLAELIERMKTVPFSAPESIDQLANIALFVGGRTRLLTLTAKNPDKGIAKLVEQDAATVLQDIRSGFARIRAEVEKETESTTQGFGEFQSKENLIGFDQLFGNENVVASLKSFKRAPVKKATLLYGPPGSGKTSFAKALAKFMGLNFRIVDVSQLLSSFQGKTEQNVSELFKQINENEDELVLLDEAETLIQNRNSSSSLVSSNTIVAVFLVQLEKMSNPARLVLTTNYANRVDPAIMRRLNAIFIPYPNPGEAAYEVFYRILRTYFLEQIETNEWSQIREYFLEKTENEIFSPADFATAIDDSVLRQFEGDPLLVECGKTRGSMTNKIHNAKTGSFCMISPNGSPVKDEDEIIPHPFSAKDIVEIINNLQPSITPQQYLSYQQR